MSKFMKKYPGRTTLVMGIVENDSMNTRQIIHSPKMGIARVIRYVRRHAARGSRSRDQTILVARREYTDFFKVREQILIAKKVANRRTSNIVDVFVV